MDNKGGRPRKFETAKEFQEKVNEYFNECDNKTLRDDFGKVLSYKPYTISGLCVYLDITRETLCNYEDMDEFFDTIKKAKQKIENYVEEMSLSGVLNPTVSIFNLKNNFGWKDKTEVESTVNATIKNPYKELSIEELKKLAGE